MSVALHGNLKDFGLAEVFQLIGQQRKTGVLEISSSKVKMRLLFDEGAVVTAAPEGEADSAALGDMLVRCGLLTRERLGKLIGDAEKSARSLPALLTSTGEVAADDLEQIEELLTRETVFEVLRWKQGSFYFSAQAVPHDRPPEKLLGAEQILMDGLRMVDEWQTFAELVPSGSAVFRRSGEFSVYRQKARGDAQGRLDGAERLFQLIDGRLDARRAIDLSRLGTFEGTRILAELRQAALVELLDARSSRQLKQTEEGRRSLVAGLRWVLAAALPVALLVFEVAVIYEVWGSPAWSRRDAVQVAGVPVARAPFLEAQRAFERRRLRNAIEAHRLLLDEWPRSVDELARSGVLAADSLTSPSLGSYYYLRSERGALLLAPEY